MSEKMDLDDWRKQVSRPLELITAGSEMAARHTRLLVGRPGFETTAQDELDQTERVLESALAKVREAKAAYANKPRVS
jgi:hypothetical protein